MQSTTHHKARSAKLRFRAAALIYAAAFMASCSAEPGDDFALVGEANAAEGKIIAAPVAPIAEPKGKQVAVFAGGCFWGVEGVFERVKGVTSVQSGYSGGKKADADYATVSSGGSAHAESVRITYDPAKVSYNMLLHIFFSVAHDPTQLNRQGPDTGSQYRSAIFPANAAQRAAAKAYIAQLGKDGSWKKPIVTKIEAFGFFPAEAYHQDFMRKNPDHPYIRAWDAPKVSALKRLFPTIYR
jgi:peptide-methionine (S)-S-oxide reductase